MSNEKNNQVSVPQADEPWSVADVSSTDSTLEREASVVKPVSFTWAYAFAPTVDRKS